MQGWTQKALVGTFMGGLKSEIAEGIRMFRPKTLKEAISLARMRDEQLLRQHRFSRPTPTTRLLPTPTTRPLPTLPSSTRQYPSTPVKRLTWEEMQRKRAQGLCFNCNDKFTAGHKCQYAQLLLLEGCEPISEIQCEEIMEEPTAEVTTGEQTKPEPEISLHALTGWSTTRTM